MRYILISLLLVVSGCATISEAGKKVIVSANIDKSCKNLGPVTVNITGWGLPEESMNVLRNKTATKGGNTLSQTGPNSGIAYLCPENVQQ